jgi:CubicO group peptidase (beta-lactamase class C family)
MNSANSKPSGKPPSTESFRRLTARLILFTQVVILAVQFLVPPRLSADVVDDYLERTARRQEFPGLSVAVIRDGKLLKARGYGRANLENQVPASVETIYDLASLTKPFVAEAILLLLQEGKLALDDPLSGYLQGTPAAWSGVTLRHLLAHTSGIPDYLNDLGRNFPHHTGAEEFLKAMVDVSLVFPPGEKWSYSNSGYILLGMVVQKVAGESYDALLSRRVFGPLGMEDTLRDSVDAIVARRATGYVSGPDGLRNGTYLKHLMMNHGDRGLVSSVLDLAKWDASLDGDRILSAETKRLMWTPVRLNGGGTFGYGLGWFLGESDGRHFVRHPGGSPGTATVLTRFVDDHLTVILLANRGQAALHGTDLGVARFYIPAMRRSVVPARAESIKAASGYYNLFGGQMLRVTGGEAFIELEGAGFNGRFLPVAENRFAAEGPDHELVLSVSNGLVRSATMKFDGQTTELCRLGPLVRAVSHEVDSDPGLTRKVESLLVVLGRGAREDDDLSAVAPQTRVDFGHDPVGEVAGVKSARFIASRDLLPGQVRRHGALVARVLYLVAKTDRGERALLASLDQDGKLADIDVISE